MHTIESKLLTGVVG